MDLNAKTDAFVAKYKGIHIDEDGYYGAQCWDVVARFAREMIGCPFFPTGSGGAEGLYRLFQDPIPQYFDRVAASDARKGDIAVFPGSFSPPWGHTALIISRSGNSVNVLEQNGNNPGGVSYITTRYVSQMSGVLRAKGASDVSKTDLTIARILTFGILGRNGSDGSVNALGGGADGDLNQYHVGAETNDKIWQLYQSGEGQEWKNIRLPRLIAGSAQAAALGKQLTEANSALAGLKTKIDEMAGRPTVGQFEDLQKAVTEANNKALAAQAELEKVQAENVEADKVGNAFIRWIGKLFGVKGA